jgi:hypothetical protein
MRDCRYPWVVLAVVVVASLATADYWLRAEDSSSRSSKRTEKKAPPKRVESEPLKVPPNWPANHPLPQVATNCVRCHLTAGRELTAAARDFAHSVHDLNQMSCSDCHGGNTEDDVKAHEDEFGFIGTKLSAHIKKCGECHAEEAETIASGPHHWDFSKRINTKYPMCIDCHGNHDIGNPPADFKLADVCADCHRNFQQKFPQIAAIVAQEDQLWQTIVALREAKLGATTKRVPDELEPDVAAVRHDAMQAFHASKELSPEQAKDLAARMATLRSKLQNWLKMAN